MVMPLSGLKGCYLLLQLVIVHEDLRRQDFLGSVIKAFY